MHILRSNVVQAMGLRQHPLLSHLRQILLKDPLVLLSAVEAMPGARPLSYSLPIFSLFGRSTGCAVPSWLSCVLNIRFNDRDTSDRQAVRDWSFI